MLFTSEKRLKSVRILNPLLFVVCFVLFSGEAVKVRSQGAASEKNSVVSAKPTDQLLNLIDAGQIVEFKGALRQRLLKKETATGKNGEAALALVMHDPDYTLDLVRYELLRGCGAEAVEELLHLSHATLFLKMVFCDRKWMEDLLCSGKPPVIGSAALYRLYCIWRADQTCQTHPVYRNLALALSIDGTRYSPQHTSALKTVQTYTWYRDCHKAGRLHAMFDDLEPWIMRQALYGDVRSASFVNADRNGPVQSYWGSCWACAYRLHTVWGDSIHGRDYYPPWMHRMSRMQANRQVGGVCGSLSTFASIVHKTHGIPSSTAGQPGHCAYVRRNSEGKWGIGYSIAHPTNSHSSFWSGAYPYLKYMEDVFKDWDKVVGACRHLWQARMHREPVSQLCRWKDIEYAAYEGDWKRLPNFKKLTPLEKGETSAFNCRMLRPADDFYGIVYTGRLAVPKKAHYNISLAANEGAKLFINEALIVNKDSNVRGVTAEKTMELTAGEHKFRLEYFERAKEELLELDIRPAKLSAKAKAAYALAARTHPLHTGVWREYCKALRTDPATDKKIWIVVAKSMAVAMESHHKPAWDNLELPLQALKDELTAKQRGELLTALHRMLPASKNQEWSSYIYSNIFKKHGKYVGGEMADQCRFLKDVLAAHETGDRYWTAAMLWGKEALGKDPKAMDAYNQMLAKMIGGDSKSLAFKSVIASMKKDLLSAANREDAKSYKSLLVLLKQLLKEEPLGSWHLNSKQIAAYPKFTPPLGTLLSAEGVLKLSSSSSKYDQPALHPEVLRRGSKGGWCMTNSEKEPWATVVLAGPARLSSVIIVNRYESAKYMEMLVPLTVSVSDDGKQWEEVFKTETSEALWNIDLTKKQVKAKYIRCMVDNQEKADTLHLRNILVYGRKLY